MDCNKTKYSFYKTLISFIVLLTFGFSCSDSDDEKAEGKYQYDDVWINIYTSYYYYTTDFSTGKTTYTFFFSPDLCIPDDVHVSNEGISSGVDGIYLSVEADSLGRDLSAESNPAAWSFYYTETWNQTVSEGSMFVAQNKDNSEMFDITFEIVLDNGQRIKGEFHGTCTYCETGFSFKQ